MYFRGAGNDVLPPGLAVTKSLRPYTTFELDQFRQLARRYHTVLYWPEFENIVLNVSVQVHVCGFCTFVIVIVTVCNVNFVGNRLLETGLPSFDTVMHNSTCLFARSWQNCTNSLIEYLRALRI